MEGYTAIAEELRETFEDGGSWPDVVYLQAGVGGLAAATAARIRAAWAVQPRIVVVEPDAAPCLKRSVEAGRMTTVHGPASIMERLDCKAPSMLALAILRDVADEFALVSDEEARDAAALMAADGLPTTPSGAAGVAAWRRGGGDRPLAILTEGPME